MMNSKVRNIFSLILHMYYHICKYIHIFSRSTFIAQWAAISLQLFRTLAHISARVVYLLRMTPNMLPNHQCHQTTWVNDVIRVIDLCSLHKQPLWDSIYNHLVMMLCNDCISACYYRSRYRLLFTFHSVWIYQLIFPCTKWPPFADSFNRIFITEKFNISFQLSLKIVPNVSIEYFGVLVQVMAWCRAGDRPLPEPMLTQSTDLYKGH